MEFDFDTVVDRTGTNSTKIDKYRNQDILPLWVADMDFRSPQPVIDALVKRAEHGVFGYTETPDELVELIIARMKRVYGWEIASEDLVFLPGVVPALNVAARAFAEDDQSVVTLTPIYPPFLSAPEYAGRRRVDVPALYEDGAWSLPFDDLAAAMSNNAGVFLLCNPYNPVGRCLTRSELEQIVDYCRENNVVICSDEIHCDLIFDGRQHLPTATLGRDAADITVTLMAPSKTFNLAGFGGSFAIIQNPELRERFTEERHGIVGNVGVLAYESMVAAYRHGEAWHRALVTYLAANRDYLAEELNRIDGIRMNHVEGTYLAWLDVSALGLDDPPAFFEHHGLGMSEGYRFGDDRFMRLNFGCARSMLEKAVSRIKDAAQAAF